jgi:hypothetical protein
MISTPGLCFETWTIPTTWSFPAAATTPPTVPGSTSFAVRLDQRFHCTCTVDRNVQDASHHGTIIIPATATASAEHITITISNFGNLAAVTLGNPGTYSEEEERNLFQDNDRRHIEAELGTLGYIAVSEHPLWTRYDGISNLASCYSPEHPPTWWTRFFDYL